MEMSLYSPPLFSTVSIFSHSKENQSCRIDRSLDSLLSSSLQRSTSNITLIPLHTLSSASQHGGQGDTPQAQHPAKYHYQHPVEKYL